MNINKIETTERTECSADTKLFFDDVYKSGTRTKKAQVETVQYGRSMIEMLGVLAIVGVLSVGGIAGYSKAMTKFKINKTIDEVSHIVANIRTLYAQQSEYSGLYTEDGVSYVVNMGILPDSLATTNIRPYIKNSFNGDVYIDNYDAIGSSLGGDYFGIQYNGLPKDACVALASYDWGDKHSTGLIGMAVGSGYISNYNRFANDNWDGLRSKGCYTNNNNDLTCIGQTMPISNIASACKCDVSGCGVFWLYQ